MILVTGASGFIGRALVARLARNDAPVRILLPRRGRHRRVWPESVTTVPGSIYDEEDLHQAMIGVHTVFHLASAQWWGRRSDLDRVDLQGTRNVITAARSVRIGRLVVMSHLGAAPSSAYTLMRAKGQLEELVRASGLPYTIFRSGIVFGREDSFVNGIAMLLRANPLIFLQPGTGPGRFGRRRLRDPHRFGQRLEHDLPTDGTDGTRLRGGAEFVRVHHPPPTRRRDVHVPDTTVDYTDPRAQG